MRNINGWFSGISLLLGLTLLGFTAVGSGCAYNWPQFGGNAQHTGSNLQETLINGGNVSRLKQLFQVTLASSIDGPLAYVSGVATPAGVRDVVYGTTWVGGIVALDAHTGAQVWGSARRPNHWWNTARAKSAATV